MKKNLFFLFALAIAFASCKKDDSVIAPSNNENVQKTIAPPLMAFTKKVLVEEFVGCGYGNVPYSNYILNSFSGNHRVIVASMHINDVMQLNGNMQLASSFSNGSSVNIPCALIDRSGNNGSRLNNYTQYNTGIQQMLSQSAPCGLAIASSVNRGIAAIDVRTKFSSTLSGMYNINVYLVHESVNSASPYYGQANAFNATPGNPFNGMGNPILPYDHQHVVFKMLTTSGAGKVNTAAQVPGGIDTHSYTCDMSSNMIGNDCYVIAFITNSTTRQVLNVQKVKLGMNKNWD